MEINYFIDILITLSGGIISISLAIIAFFLVNYFKSSKNNVNQLHDKDEIMDREINVLKSDIAQANTVIKSNREFLEHSVSLQNSFLREQVETLKTEMRIGFKAIENKLK